MKSDIHFLNIRKSKTDAGIRLVPLHPKIHKSLEEWMHEKRLSGEDYLFVRNGSQRIFKNLKKANIFMGSLLGRFSTFSQPSA